MSKRVIAQPLPVGIRDWSFRGLDCQGWDFSGRDIRGCDFRNTKLNGANFTQAIAGRSKKQQTKDIIIVVVAGAVAVFARNAIDAFAKGQIVVGIVFNVLAIAAWAYAIYASREAVKEFKNATGTDFSSAIMSVNFTDAVLNNCKFDNAETSHVN